MKKIKEPLQMDRNTRNKRLYKNLLNMGLVVSPIFNSGKIDHLIVSCDLPKKIPSYGQDHG
jgi:hypothetical protein